ncbi:Zinc finger CCHC domain-containing protein 7, partial [Dryobates pubescens]
IEDPEEYEDELYQEESSSEQSIDSEVEFHLYSQIHYSQNLGEASSLGRDEEGGAAGLRDGPPAPGEQHREEGSSAAAAGSTAQAAEDPEVIVLSDGPEDDSVYTSKAKRPRRSNAQGKAQIQPATSTPMQAEGAAHTMWGSSKKRKSSSKQLSPVSPAGAFALQEVLVIESSEEESLESESDHIESWMLVGAGSDDKDGDIILNLEGCATPTSQG